MFQCNLESEFRKQECDQSDIGVKYLSSNISSPQLDDLTIQFQPRHTLGILIIEISYFN